MTKTSVLIMVATGLIFIALIATGYQIFFVSLLGNYDVAYGDDDMNWSLFNTSSYSSLEETTKELEDKFGESVEQPSGYINWFDTTWNTVKTAVTSLYNSLGISVYMIQGAGQGILSSAGVSTDWIVSGLVAIVSLTLILLIIGWWMNR